MRRSLARRQLPVSVVDDLLALDADWRTAVTAADAAKAERNRVSAEFATAKGSRRMCSPGYANNRVRSGRASPPPKSRLPRSSTASTSCCSRSPTSWRTTSPTGSMPRATSSCVRAARPRRSRSNPRRIGRSASGSASWTSSRRAAGAQPLHRPLRGRCAIEPRARQLLPRTQPDGGFAEIAPPLLVNRETVEATGRLSKFSDAMFSLDDGSLFLSPTSEVQLVNLHRGEIMEAADLPKRYTAYTACFRQEAGAAGKDARGLIRQHQFEKVELARCAGRKRRARCTADRAPGREPARRARAALSAYEACSADTGFASRKALIWRYGCPVNPRIARSHRAAIAATSNRAVVAYVIPRAKGAAEFMHTLNGQRSRSDGPCSRSSRAVGTKTARCASRKSCSRTSTGWRASADAGPPALAVQSSPHSAQRGVTRAALVACASRHGELPVRSFWRMRALGGDHDRRCVASTRHTRKQRAFRLR